MCLDSGRGHGVGSSDLNQSFTENKAVINGGNDTNMLFHISAEN